MLSPREADESDICTSRPNLSTVWNFYLHIKNVICHIDTYTYNLLWNIPTNLRARYDLFCVKSAVQHVSDLHLKFAL